ncbi:MAG TPA: GNAT family N-acetyltransferase [Dongiaceae bacterium]|nr:GNAT family N-acetyltransferase [Dongiaceae bacterium]
MACEIRRPRAEESAAILALVSDVVNATYGAIWPTSPIEVAEEDWSAGWVAAISSDPVGWMLSREQWLEDLWVSYDFHNRGAGSALLAQAEREIAARGIATAHLSVIASNVRAIAFYERNGWRGLRETPHERLPVPRLEMIKTVG